MSEEKEKLKVEGKPPLEKRSMVSEDDLLIKEAAEKVRKGEEVEIPNDSILLLFIGEGIRDLNVQMAQLLAIFQKADKAGVHVSEGESHKTPAEKVKAASPLEISQAENRVEKIVLAFKPFAEDVTVDIEKSAQFVMVKPKVYFTDKTKWVNINVVSIALGGTWLPQGGESHWKIPKIVKKLAEPKQELEQSQAPKTADPPTELEHIKMMFPEDLENLLAFTEKDGVIIIKPRQFLGTENFTKIASVVRAASGEYVSAGKDSHFKVPLGGK